MRKKHDVLMDGGEPVGGKWNLDDQNRDAFGKEGPGNVTGPHAFRPDEITRGRVRVGRAAVWRSSRSAR